MNIFNIAPTREPAKACVVLGVPSTLKAESLDLNRSKLQSKEVI